MVLHLPPDIHRQLCRVTRQGEYASSLDTLREALSLLEVRNRRLQGQPGDSTPLRELTLMDEERQILQEADAEPALV